MFAHHPLVHREAETMRAKIAKTTMSTQPKHLGNPPLEASCQGGRTKPFKHSTEHPLSLDVGLRHPIIPQSL